MSAPDNSGPAFPRPVSFSDQGGVHYGQTGMSIRDYFAGQALAGLLASGHFTYSADDSDGHEPTVIRTRAPELDDNGEETGKKKTYFPVVEEAAIIADFMVRELGKKDGR